eukprot:CAMPEP_0197465794 /NCGR_PEP_ID=MMETSP1175-20131217/64719_1 /TAXON_ID=1003142 /ORGANISM="Triceratium dubium, Strain CCMP147" /LENGTH=447 /DNA_ID=CAMNT_0043001817 /DNA_START=541 /DNA_END=1884 /DNA_ORIENTATION=-
MSRVESSLSPFAEDGTATPRTADFEEDELDAHQRAVRDLEAEVKLLDWHRLANESSLRAALLRTKRMRQRQREEVDGMLGVRGEGRGGRPRPSAASASPTPSAFASPPSRGAAGALAGSDSHLRTEFSPPPSRRMALRMMEEEERCKPLGPDIDDEDAFQCHGMTSSEPVTSRQLESIRKAIARVEGRRLAQERRKTCGMFQRTNDLRVDRCEWEEEHQGGDAVTGGYGEEGSEKENGLFYCDSRRKMQISYPKEGGDGDQRAVTVLAGLDKLLALERRIRAMEEQERTKYDLERHTSQRRRVQTAPASKNAGAANFFDRAMSAGGCSHRGHSGSFSCTRSSNRSELNSYDGDDVRKLARRNAVLVAARRRNQGGPMLQEEKLGNLASSLHRASSDISQLPPKRQTVRFDDSRCHTAPDRAISHARRPMSALRQRKPSTTDGQRSFT